MCCDCMLDCMLDCVLDCVLDLRCDFMLMFSACQTAWDNRSGQIPKSDVINTVESTHSKSLPQFETLYLTHIRRVVLPGCHSRLLRTRTHAEYRQAHTEYHHTHTHTHTNISRKLLHDNNNSSNPAERRAIAPALISGIDM